MTVRVFALLGGIDGHTPHSRTSGYSSRMCSLQLGLLAHVSAACFSLMSASLTAAGFFALSDLFITPGTIGTLMPQ